MGSGELISNNTLYICRHGRTVWNSEGRIQGQKDSPLLPESYVQLSLIREYFSGIFFDKFYCSTQKRARESIAALGKLNAGEIIFDHALCELCHGIYEGKTKAEIDPEWKKKRLQDKWSIAWPGGESYQDVYERIALFIQRLCLEGETLGFMGHETTNRVLLGTLFGWSREKIFELKQPNSVVYKIASGSLTRIDFDSRKEEKIYKKEDV